MAGTRAKLAALNAEMATLDASKAPRASTRESTAETRARRDALERDRRGVEAEIKALEALRDNQARRLKKAEMLAELAALDARCAEFAAEIGREFAPLAKTIVALMATSRRVRALREKKGTSARLAPLRGIVISDEFCASLRLPCIDADGMTGYLWYSGRPADIDKIEAADATPLDEIDVKDLEQADRAAKQAMQKIAGAYKNAALGIVGLIKRDNEFARQVREMNTRIDGPLSWGAPTPTERLTGGRVHELGPMIRLPSADGLGSPIW